MMPFVGNVAGHSDPRTTKIYTHFQCLKLRPLCRPFVIVVDWRIILWLKENGEVIM
jgi:hypothetical protein